jgi:hypothetical protein
MSRESPAFAPVAGGAHPCGAAAAGAHGRAGRQPTVLPLNTFSIRSGMSPAPLLVPIPCPVLPEREGAPVPAPSETRVIEVDGVSYRVSVTRQGAGEELLTCTAALGQPLASYSARRRIRGALAAAAAGATLVFTDSAHSAEVWSWVDRRGSGPPSYRERLVPAGYWLRGGRPAPSRTEAPESAPAGEHEDDPEVLLPVSILRRAGAEPREIGHAGGPWQTLQDLIEAPSGPGQLRAVWRAVTRLRVLDADCGTGAWLLRAASVLEHVYLACIEQMGIWVAETRLQRTPPRADSLKDFRIVLARAGEAAHGDQRREFARESGALLNLHGVARTGREAAECRRKMGASLWTAGEEGRLPGIALNVRAGDPARGIATPDELRSRLASARDPEAALARLCEEAEAIGRAERFLRTSRFEAATGSDSLQLGLQSVRTRVRALNRELDALSRASGPRAGDHNGPLDAGRPRPLHLFAEWHSVIRAGGFDVVRGAS